MPSNSGGVFDFGPPDDSSGNVIELDRQWRITGLSANARQRLGMGGECLGRNLWQLFPLSAATYAREVLQKALDEDEGVRFHFYGRELGSWFQVAVHPTPWGLEVDFRDMVETTAEISHPLDAAVAAAAVERMTEGGLETTELLRAELTEPDTSRRSYSEGQLARLAEAIYRERRRRAQLLPVEYGEPQWDILLDLFIHGIRGNRVSVTSACIAADVPLSTAMRALERLTSSDLVLRSEDQQDKRRTWVALTKRGMDAMRTYLRQSLVSPLNQSTSLR